MSLISDKSQKDKLKKEKINIKTKYIVGNEILERNTDNSHNDDIVKGIRCKKEYYLDGKLLHTENHFDSRMEYTFISKDQENMDYECPNCGMNSKVKDFIDGCPYCKTNYNIDYTEKELGGKYHYDRVLRSTTYRVVTGVVDIIVSLVLAFIFIKLTSRTFNSYDITKIFIYGGIFALILYYFFYIIDAYIVLGPIKAYKDKQNLQQYYFWESTQLDKKNFFNNLNYELGNKYYSNLNIIDYDIIDFDSFKEYTENDTLYIKINAYVRIITFNNGKIDSKYINETYILKHLSSDILKLKNGTNEIKCPNCGASIDATKGECSYCHTKIKNLQEWVLEK